MWPVVYEITQRDLRALVMAAGQHYLSEVVAVAAQTGKPSCPDLTALDEVLSRWEPVVGKAGWKGRHRATEKSAPRHLNPWWASQVIECLRLEMVELRQGQRSELSPPLSREIGRLLRDEAEGPNGEPVVAKGRQKRRLIEMLRQIGRPGDE